VDRAGSTHERGEKCVQNFKEREYSEDPIANERIRLKLVIKKFVARM
jgi:hypothetical protein